MRNKLKRKSGAALVLALMFFLLCACVGVLVVTAASANTGKTAKMRADEQSYQSVKAAANAMAEIMKSSPYQAGYIEYYEGRTVTIKAPDGTTSSKVEESTGALKPSIEDPKLNGFKGSLGSLLDNSIRNIYLHHTALSNGQILLNNVASNKGDAPGIWNSPEVKNLGPDKYELTFKVDSFPDVLLSLHINRGSTETSGKLYDATITARDTAGHYEVILKSEATKVDAPIRPVETGDISSKKTIETSYSSLISWVSWEAV